MFLWNVSSVEFWCDVSKVTRRITELLNAKWFANKHADNYFSSLIFKLALASTLVKCPIYFLPVSASCMLLSTLSHSDASWLTSCNITPLPMTLNPSSSADFLSPSSLGLRSLSSVSKSPWPAASIPLSLNSYLKPPYPISSWYSSCRSLPLYADILLVI